jgi:microcystin-dependent protein
MAHRAGFRIPNASSDQIVNFRQAEPDAGDFSILGNDRYGVFYGCGVSTSGTGGFTVSLEAGPHIILVDGVVQQIPSSASVSLSTGATTDRFDLVGWDAQANALAAISGIPVDDPTFPDIPNSFVVFAAVLVPAGASNITPYNLTDKRRMLLHGARGAAAAGDTFLRNLLPDGGVGFQATGSGAISWANSAVTLQYDGTDLVISGKKLAANNGLSVTGAVTVQGAVTATGDFAADNFKRGAGNPTGLGVTGKYGDEFSNTLTGQKYIWRGPSVGWAEIYADEYPPGTVIASLLTGADASTHMVGWLPLTGQTYPESAVGRLADLAAPFSSWDNNNGTWTLPNLQGRTLLGGTPGTLAGSNSVVLTEANLPAHRHFNNVGVTATAGEHSHSGSANSAGQHSHNVTAGQHSHPVNDPGHAHRGQHGLNVPTNFIVTMWGGESTLDGIVTDSSHTWRVGAMPFTTIDKTDITIPSSGAHTHAVTLTGSHTHTVSISSAGGHTHSLPPESAVGESRSVNTTPSHLAVTYYVKI